MKTNDRAGPKRLEKNWKPRKLQALRRRIGDLAERGNRLGMGSRVVASLCTTVRAPRMLARSPVTGTFCRRMPRAVSSC